MESTSPTVTPQTVSFLDLAPETRNQIYGYLFQDQTIMISNQDRMGQRERERSGISWEEAEDRVILRDQSIGLNLLLTCNTVLAEAKPLLLGVAVFNINFDVILNHRTGSQKLRRMQGFTQDDLALVKSLELHRIPTDSKKTCVQLLWMPCLRTLTFYDPRGNPRFWYDSYFNPLGRVSKFETVIQTLKEAGERESKKYQCIYKCPDTSMAAGIVRTFLCFDS